MNCHETQLTSDLVPAWTIVEVLAPHLFWGLVILLVIMFIGLGRIREAVLNARKIGFGGFEIELKGAIAEAAQARSINLPQHVRDQLVHRIERLRPLLLTGRVLWIDDMPTSNAAEIGILTSLGVAVDLARNDEEARRRLSEGVYDLVLSDMRRGQEAEAGKAFLPEVKAAVLSPPLVFYVGQTADTPKDAFGLTTRPDELFHLILDVFERRRG